MIGETCEGCGDEVLIRKNLDGRKLCLDCYCKYKDGETILPEKISIDGDIEAVIQKRSSPELLHTRQQNDRRCPNCGRIIPFDSIICPYCGKKFESFL
jgi:hypothetical protein